MKREQKKKKSNLLLLLAPLLLFAAGAGIFLYPAISNYLAERQQTEVIHTYQAKVNEMDQAEIDAAWQAAAEYNENLAGDPVHDPFVMGSGYVLPDNYEEVLNVNGDGGWDISISRRLTFTCRSITEPVKKCWRKAPDILR